MSQSAFPESLLHRLLRRLNLDPILLTAILCLSVAGFMVLYSASGGNMDVLTRQGIRLGMALLIMLLIAMAPPPVFYQWSPIIYVGVALMLLLVLLTGSTGKGAQRWLDLGFIRFQPAELMKIAMPMMISFYFSERRLPPSLRDLFIACLLVLVPAFVIFLQPDLGTALLISAAGLTVIFLAGIRWRTIIVTLLAGMASMPVLWNFMHGYQRRRVMTFL
ncbi:MAG TPA: rod shape-determining protein RodA, partial [Gammaproteobacteria bacterium]|nr:rod shape-determining protein RodA [Gammaproteobacteria bacterium]